MADYYLVHDAAFFEDRARPALARSWRERAFGPCRALCEEVAPAARDYAERYHTGPDEPLLCQLARAPSSSRIPFARDLWRALVGEVLLYAAVDIPEFQVCADTLCCLLAPEQYGADVVERERLAPIQQAHRGSRDLTFGAAVYRPVHAGYNNAADVARLAEYLEGVNPDQWTVAALAQLREADDDEERTEELAFVREWFPALCDLYRRARAGGRVVVIESIY
jgi:hypothetical protein